MKLTLEQARLTRRLAIRRHGELEQRGARITPDEAAEKRELFYLVCALDEPVEA